MKRRFLFVCAVWLVLFVRISGEGISGEAITASAISNPRQKEIAEGLLADAMGGDFASSLEMKEATDFLITPALLVQEALLNDVVITYPAE